MPSQTESQFPDPTVESLKKHVDSLISRVTRLERELNNVIKTGGRVLPIDWDNK